MELMKKRLTGNDCDIDGQWEYLDEKQYRIDNLNRLFDGASRDDEVGPKMMEAGDELTRKAD